MASTGQPDDPCFELWTTLAAIGASTSRALVGPLVAAIALRNPGVTSKAITTLDHITGGRAVLGLGSGWLKLEYGSHGLPFGDGSALRARRLEEGIQIIQQLLAGETVTHHSECYEISAAKHAPSQFSPESLCLLVARARVCCRWWPVTLICGTLAVASTKLRWPAPRSEGIASVLAARIARSSA